VWFQNIREIAAAFVEAVVDAQGHTQDVRVIRALGMGLD
jgi:hypothetical protein